MAPKIHTYAASPKKFLVSSFIVEGATGTVLIDTQFLLSSARELAARLSAIGKPLEAVIITHPHPDHFNGLPLILETFGQVPVFANRTTINGIAATQKEKRTAWNPVFGQDYPPTDALPNRALGPNEIITLAEIEFQVIEFGLGESSDITDIHIPAADALIASDLVYNLCHPWLAEHRTNQWIKQLDLVISRFGSVDTFLAGHGPSGSSGLLREQHAYIEAFTRIVASKMRNGVLDTAAIAAIKAATTQDREGWPLELLIELNAKAIADAPT
jgi:glyoxylase-like metal-dependent hydrolase (beta-lactamase superfamily II)